MASNPPAPRTDWSEVIASLLNPTMVTTILGAAAAIGLGAMHTFGAPIDQDLVYLGLGLLGGSAVTHRA